METSNNQAHTQSASSVLQSTIDNNNSPAPSFVSVTTIDIVPCIGTIYRLPPEILATIFQAYVDRNDSPWNLVCVCVIWARVALKTKALWRYISLVDDQSIRTLGRKWSVPGFDGDLLSDGRRQICTTKKEMEEAFLRAGMAPLDVELHLGGGPISEPHPPTQDILSRIFGQSKVSSQIARLDFFQVPTEAPTFQPACLPRLREFKWMTPSAPCQEWAPFLGHLLSQCKELHSLHLTHEVVLLLQDIVTWGNLQSLAVEENDDWDSTLEALDIVLPQCSSLEELRVMSLDVWPNETSLSITCPRLRTLELSHESKHLGRIRAPMLTSLEINVEDAFRIPAPYSPSWETDLRWNGEADDTGLEFPLLERFDVRSEYPGWIFRLKLPSLKSLDFHLQSTAPRLAARVASKSTEFGDIFRADWFPTVHTVKFSAVGYSPLFVAALRSVPNAGQITLIPERKHDLGLIRMRLIAEEPLYPDFGSSVPRQLCVRDPDFLCPKASHIQIGDQWHKLDADPKLDRSLRELVEVRKQRNVPLRSLRVYLQDHESFVEYV